MIYGSIFSKNKIMLFVSLNYCDSAKCKKKKITI